MTEHELIEKLADAEHASWAYWMDYLFSQCAGPTPDAGLERLRQGSYIIPPELVERWQRQAATPYADLSEREKQSDRDEVAKILPHIKAYASTPVGTCTASILVACQECGGEFVVNLSEIERQAEEQYDTFGQTGPCCGGVVGSTVSSSGR